MNYQIKPLSGIAMDSLFSAFRKAFADYEMQLSKDEFLKMMIRRGFDPDLSFAAFDGKDMVSFTLNGIGMFNQLKTAYDTGTGTLKEYRGKGLAAKVFEFSIPFLKEAGIKQYLLEVLQHNAAAISVYKKLGFEVSREFNYFVKSCSDYKPEKVKEFYQYPLLPIELDEALIPDFFDFNPSWQNSFDAIARKPGNFIAYGARDKDKIIGCLIFEPVSGDVTQLAVHPDYRRKGIGTRLLKKAFELNQNSIIKIINTEKNCGSVNGFLKAHSFNPSGEQFEMIKSLN